MGNALTLSLALAALALAGPPWRSSPMPTIRRLPDGPAKY